MTHAHRVLSRSLMGLAACASFGAQAATIGFDGFDTSQLTLTVNHVESGFVLTGDSLYVIGGNYSSLYSTGSNSMLSNVGNGNVTLTKLGGGAFAFNSIDVSEVYNFGTLSPTNVHFVAQLSGGGTADYVFNLDLNFGNQTVNFGGLFDNVTSVSWAQTFNYHQFDNLVMDAGTTVPEPTSLVLAGLALVGAGVARRKAAKRG